MQHFRPTKIHNMVGNRVKKKHGKMTSSLTRHATPVVAERENCEGEAPEDCERKSKYDGEDAIHPHLRLCEQLKPEEAGVESFTRSILRTDVTTYGFAESPDTIEAVYFHFRFRENFVESNL